MISSQDRPIVRAGRQKIPRPKKWRMGAAAPWVDLADQKVTMERILDAFLGRESFGVRGRQLTGKETVASVLVAIYDLGGPNIILTRRSHQLMSHSHEVSFPGGRREDGDPDLWFTAVREAGEEIGIDPSWPHFIGCSDLVATADSANIIHPLVAILPNPPELTANPEEVEAILCVPLNDLLVKGVYREEEWEFPEGPWRISFFELETDTVWGATASILRQILCLALGIDDGLKYVRVDDDV